MRRFLKTHDYKFLESLRERTKKALSGHIDFSKPVALVDIPTHTNSGDLMILRGEQTYLEELNADIGYVSDIQRFDAEILRSKMPSGTILIHGGGNLGDIWPLHHNFKERLATELPDYPIVQLPQTTYFEEITNAERANTAFTKHGNFTLMLRDTPSMERAETYFPQLDPVFVPDAAFGWKLDPSQDGEYSGKCVVLAREDKEANSDLSSIQPEELGFPETIVTDWKLSKLDQVLYIAARVPGKLTNGLLAHQRRKILHPTLAPAHDLAASAILRSAQQLFDGAELVITDRLHSHILATLMGIPNIVLDNSYGKVRALFDDYTGMFSTGTFAENMNEVMDLVKARN